MSTVARYKRLLSELGKSALHALYPNEFEFYLVALELVDSRNSTIDYFVFPVMPNSINRSINEISTIKKTAGGITVLTTPTFEPIDFTLSGDFGRRLKFLLGQEELDFTGLQLSTQSGVYSRSSLLQDNSNRPQIFSKNLKTGYGACKVLNALLDKSKALDEYNRPMRLYFYNQAFGESYVVRAKSYSFQQSQDKNMIWTYNLQLKAIAPLESINTDAPGSARRNLTTSFAQKTLTSTAYDIKRKYINI